MQDQPYRHKGGQSVVLSLRHDEAALLDEVLTDLAEGMRADGDEHDERLGRALSEIADRLHTALQEAN